MTKTIVEVETAGGVARFDVAESPAVGPERVSRDGDLIVKKLDGSIEQALQSARPAAEAVISTFRALEPNELAVEFGLRIDGQVGAVIARAGIEVNFTVRLTWSPTSSAGLPQKLGTRGPEKVLVSRRLGR